MNWKEINKKYPKAFDLFFRWFKGDPKAAMTKREFLEVNDIVVMHGNLRELYDFFDEQEIVIEIGINYNFKKLTYILDEWSYDIIDYDIENQGIYASRIETEQSAFEKAFEILESKL